MKRWVLRPNKKLLRGIVKMNKVWQCERVDYHTMVRPVSRCTMCGASVREEVQKQTYESSDTISRTNQLLQLIDMGFDYKTALQLMGEPF